MTDVPLYLFSLAIIAIWARLRRDAGVRRLLILWAIGLIGMRVVPIVLAYMLPLRAFRWLPGLASAAGSIIALRALVGLTLWDRPRGVRSWILGGLALLGLFLAAIAAPGDFWGPVLLAVPWLLTARWRRGLGGKGLTLAALLGLLTLLLCAVNYGPEVLRNAILLPGIERIWSMGRSVGAIYGLVMMFATASRIHLSIRRIGRRLLASHLMAGVIPLALAGVFLLVTSALFLSTYRGSIAQRLIGATSRDAVVRLLEAVGSAEDPPREPFGSRGRAQIVIARDDGGPIHWTGGEIAVPVDSILAENTSSARAPLLFDGQTMFLRARVDTTLGGRRLERVALVPLDSLRMVEYSAIIGIPVRVNPHLHVQTSRSKLMIGSAVDDTTDSESDSEVEAERSDADSVVGRSGTIGPQNTKKWMLPGGSIIQCLTWTSRGFTLSSVPISSSAGLGEPIIALFTTARDNPLAVVVLIVLAAIAILFIIAAWITIVMVISMGRSITASVRVLTGATAALREGRLDHRIAIEGEDELWRVAASFNEMADGLEKMREMELTNERLEEELRVARRIQERLLPEAPPAMENLELAGLSLPARHVGGDYFDYIPLEGGRVAIAVADVSGKGVGAALLMSSFRASLRSQDLDRFGPAHASGILNRFVCASVDPGKFITVFLAVIEPDTGIVSYVNAGHEPPLLLGPDGEFSELDRGGLIMGAFSQAEYEEGTATMAPGSILAIFTDGVTEARDSKGGFLGDESLRNVLQRSDGVSCAQILQNIVSEIHGFAGDEPQSDDITILLARRR
jgi:serine phosphatase RsbU (regulator of sigma subunit)